MKPSISRRRSSPILGLGSRGSGDYWRLDMPLGTFVVVVSLPLLLTVWLL